MVVEQPAHESKTSARPTTVSSASRTSATRHHIIGAPADWTWPDGLWPLFALAIWGRASTVRDRNKRGRLGGYVGAQRRGDAKTMASTPSWGRSFATAAPAPCTYVGGTPQLAAAPNDTKRGR